MNQTRAVTMMDVLFTRATLVRDLFLVLSFGAATALSAQITILLPWTPVPVTGQTLVVLLAGALLGSRRGALSQLSYLGAGAMGLPIFSGWHGGVAHLVGPTGGYLMGFVAAAFVVGLLAERGWDRRLWTAAIAMLAGTAVIYIFGLSWLALYLPNSSLLAAGLIPFIPGDLTKLALATVALPSGWALLNRWPRGG
jgi:biotin transport system substrate-specific component